jgi:signal transduction histidine kinase
LEKLAPSSVALAPLVARGRKLGILTLSSRAPRRMAAPHMLEVARGVADRAAVAIDNARLYQQAQEAVRLREDTLAIVSHDLRNPLSSIRMSAGLLLRELPGAEGGSERPRRRLEAIQRATEHMRRLIEDLLDVSRLREGTLALEVRPVGAGELLEEVRQMMHPLADEMQVHLEVHGGAVGEAVVACDRERALQVLSNLVGNALKFTPEGGRVTVRAWREGEQVAFEVRDTGPGIPLEEQPRLFERYWQAERKGSRGAGLGLYIARGLVELHGGRIWVESRPGQGARFTFTLPLAAPEHRA